MKVDDVTKVETHETVYKGRLDPDEFQEMVLDVVRKSVGLDRYDVGLELSFRISGDPLRPELEFKLTHDHNYYRKQHAAEQ